MSEFIRTAAADGVLTITIDRPDRLGAVSNEMAGALAEALAAARHDDAVRAIVLTGTGRGFCSGADLSGGGTRGEESRWLSKSPLRHYTRVTVEIEQVDKPVIAAVNGVATGAGLSYAVACDRRIAAESARFSAIFTRRGLVPDCGISYHLPRLVGVSTAAHLFMTAEIVEAPAALAMGLVDEVCPDAELAERAHQYAAGLARGASVAVELSRRLARGSLERSLEQCIAYESWAQSVVGGTQDRIEGGRAFVERRPPRFEGR